MLSLHHIGIAAEDMDTLTAYVKELFSVKEESEEVFDELQNAHLKMLTLQDGSMLELITGDQVARLVKKRQFLYHTCYETENLDQTIAEFMAKDAMMVSEPKPAVLFGGKRVAFLMTEIGLMELVEK